MCSVAHVFQMETGRLFQSAICQITAEMTYWKNWTFYIIWISNDALKNVLNYASSLGASCRATTRNNPDSKVHGANMGPIWGRQDPGGRHVGPMNLVIWEPTKCTQLYIWYEL